MGKRKRERPGMDDEAVADMTPMIDVTFQLIIFFMLQKFKTLEGKLSAFLPKDVGVNTTSAQPMEKLDVHVYLVKGKKGSFTMKDGRKVWTGRKIWWKIQDKPYYSESAFKKGLREFCKRMRDPKDPNHPLPVTLHAHKGVFYGEVTKTVDDILYSGFEKVTFAGGYAK